MTRKRAILIISLATVLALLAGWRTLKVGFNYDFEAFFPGHDPETEFFQEYRKKFGPDNDFILVGLKAQGSVFDPVFIHEANALADSLRRVQYVESVVNPLEMKEVIRDPLLGTPVQVPYFRPDSAQFRGIDSVRVSETPELMGQLVSRDGKSITLFINHTPYIGDTACQPLTQQVREMGMHFNFAEYHVAGRCVGQSYYVDVIRTELIIFLLVAFLFIIFVLILIYRSFWGVCIPLITVGLTVLYSVAFMEITGKEMDVLANVIPTILVIVGLSVAIHLQTKTLDLMAGGMPKPDALKVALSQVKWPASFTTLTTVVGFVSLATTRILPIDDFGIYSAVGVIIGYILSMLLIPALLFITPIRVKEKKRGTGWDQWLQAILTATLKNSKKVLVISVVFTAVCLAGAFMIRENTYLLEDMRVDNPVRQGFMFFGDNFAGTRPLELGLEVKKADTDIWDPELLKAQDRLAELVDSVYGVSFTISPLTLVKGAFRSMAGGDPSAFKLPDSDARIRRAVREIKRFVELEMLETMVTEDGHWARFRGMMPDIGSSKAWELRQQLTQAIETEIDSTLIKVYITGTAELIDKNNRNLALNIGFGLVIAFVLITLIFGIQFKSWKMIFISLIPNVLPILFLAGVMGYFGISLKISTAILFTIAFGIAVDDTIHFLGKLRMVQNKSEDLLYALRTTYLTTGKAMIFTSSILCVGFLILGISDFQATRLIGILISAVLFFALLCDLFLLPVLLMTFMRKKNTYTNHINKS